MAAPSRAQLEFHARDDEAVEIVALESAGAVAEPAVAHWSSCTTLERVAIHGLDTGDGAGHFLSVGADVLHRRAADLTRNSRQALEPCAVSRDRRGDERDPTARRPRRGTRVSIRVRVGSHAANVHVDHETVESLVGEDDVAAAAEDVHRQTRARAPTSAPRRAAPASRNLTERSALPHRRRACSSSDRRTTSLRSVVMRVMLCVRRVRSSGPLAGDERGRRLLARAHANSIESPGASCPAIGRSAAITDAILGYPPAVWRSAISRIGSPAAGTWIAPNASGSEMGSGPGVTHQRRSFEPISHAIRSRRHAEAHRRERARRLGWKRVGLRARQQAQPARPLAGRIMPLARRGREDRATAGIGS